MESKIITEIKRTVDRIDLAITGDPPRGIRGIVQTLSEHSDKISTHEDRMDAQDKEIARLKYRIKWSLIKAGAASGASAAGGYAAYPFLKPLMAKGILKAIGFLVSAIGTMVVLVVIGTFVL